MKVGLLGLGQMGRAVARRLIAAGYQLKLYNRTASKLVALVREGAAQATTPRELAEVSDIVITTVSDDEAFHSVISGPEGIAAGIGEGAILIDMSTLTAGAIADAAEAVGRRGAKMLHAPILGGPKNVFIGSATITVGGDEADFRRARPLLEAVSQPVFHVGPLEKGTHMKMALNIMLSHLLMGTASCLAFAKRAGLDQELILSTLQRVAGGVIEGSGEKMLGEEEGVSFYMKNLEKDQRYFLEAARTLGIRLPTIEAAQKLFSKAVDEGWGEEDYTSVYRYLLRA